MFLRRVNRTAAGVAVGALMLALVIGRLWPVRANDDKPPAEASRAATKSPAGDSIAWIEATEKDETASEPSEKVSDVEGTSATQPPGFGAGGFLGGRGGGLGGKFLPNRPRYTASKNVAVTWSETGDTVWGYSLLKGKWSKLTIDPPKKDLAPTVSESVIAVSTGDRVYSFSNQTGRWAALKSNGTPEVWHDRVIVEEKGLFHIFSDVTGRWASQSDADEANVESMGTDAAGTLNSNRDTAGGTPKVASAQKKKTNKPATGAAGQLPAGRMGGAIGGSADGFGGQGGLSGGVGGQGGFGGGTGFVAHGGAGSENVIGSNLNSQPWTILPPSAMPAKQWTEGSGVVVAWSDDNETVWGYSEALRKWSKRSISPSRVQGLVPTVGTQIAAFQTDDGIHAYSATTGTWDRLKTTRPPTIIKDKLYVEDETGVHLFSASIGRWWSPQDLLQEGKVDTTAEATARLTDNPNHSTSKEGELLLQGFYAREVVDQLNAAYERNERETAQAVAEYRRARERQPVDDPVVVQLKARIESLVEKAFTVRQQAQLTEAEMARHRLKQVDSRLAERERLKQQIMQRRVRDLLDPALSWERPAESTPFRQ